MKAVTKSPTVQGGVCLREFTYCEFRSYNAYAATLLVAGRCNPEFTEAHNRALAVFLCAEHCHIRIMVGRAGQPPGWPGSSVTGIATPVRLTTHERCNSGGEFSELTEEAAIMATTPVQTPSKNIDSDRFYNISRALRFLQKIELEDKSNNELIQSARSLLAMEKERLRLLDVQALHARLNTAAQEVAA